MKILTNFYSTTKNFCLLRCECFQIMITNFGSFVHICSCWITFFFFVSPRVFSWCGRWRNSFKCSLWITPPWRLTLSVSGTMGELYPESCYSKLLWILKKEDFKWTFYYRAEFFHGDFLMNFTVGNHLSKLRLSSFYGAPKVMIFIEILLCVKWNFLSLLLHLSKHISYPNISVIRIPSVSLEE